MCCEQILTEIRDVSRRPTLRDRLRPADVGTLVNAVRQLGLMYDTLPAIDASPDPNDNFLLSLARVSRADYLITGDKSGLLALGHFAGTRITSARAFVDTFRPGTGL